MERVTIRDESIKKEGIKKINSNKKSMKCMQIGKNMMRQVKMEGREKRRRNDVPEVEKSRRQGQMPLGEDHPERHKQTGKGMGEWHDDAPN
ncbi:hypothetical protein WR25_17072 [Diploscapter pachys]|uniref:Uncharacterized protein n=1 Tax=Diploscapter pachys TaxID=2018661 RepID=A0A2A2L3J2_9BILA|nr:hypothetical protein WR25_17072 [Diploscapter pachys]